MSVTAAEVNKLRQRTGAGLMDCKEALIEADGDLEAAIDYLRKKGQKISASRADREAREGVVIAKTDSEGKKGVVIYLSCETDFVARNEDFISFAQSIADTGLDVFSSLDDLLSTDLDGQSIKDRVVEQVGKIGEKIEVASYEKLEGECLVPYIHAGNKIGVLVALNKPRTDAIEQIGKDICMQVAAMNPIALDRDDVDPSILDREMGIGKEQARAEGKNEDIVEKIAMGKLQKFYKENTLLNQQFVKDSSKTVKDVLKEIDNDLAITAFKRVASGR